MLPSSYILRDGRNTLIPGLSGQFTVGPSATLTFPAGDTTGFISLFLSFQANISGLDATVTFSNDNVTFGSPSTNPIPSNLSSFSVNCTARYFRVSLVNNDSVNPVILSMNVYGSLNETTASSSGGTYRTINDPIIGSDLLLLGKDVITASIPGIGMNNISSLYPGSLSVQEYKSSTRQSNLVPPKCLNKMSLKIRGMVLSDPSGTGVVTPGSGFLSVSNTNDTYLESFTGSNYGSMNDVFILRFDASFTSGDTSLSFGDQYTGVGTQVGVFGIKYITGNIPQVYSFPVSTAGSSGDVSITIGTKTWTVTGVTPYSAYPSYASQKANNQLVTSYATQIEMIARRVGPCSSDATCSNASTIFFTGSPSVVMGTVGTPVFIPKSSFNIDKMDGSGYLPNIDTTQGVSGELVFDSAGDILLMITDPRNGSLVPVHRTRAANKLFLGFQSKLNVMVQNGAVTYRQMELWSYRSELGSDPLQVTKNNNIFYPSSVLTHGYLNRYFYMGQIGIKRINGRAKKITVYGSQFPVCLLAGTTSFPYISATAASETGFISVNGDGIYSTTTQPAYISFANGENTSPDRVIQEVLPVNGICTFEDIQIDLYDCLFVGINMRYAGQISMKCIVELQYTI